MSKRKTTTSTFHDRVMEMVRCQGKGRRQAARELAADDPQGYQAWLEEQNRTKSERSDTN